VIRPTGSIALIPGDLAKVPTEGQVDEIYWVKTKLATQELDRKKDYC
jgi:hypothetical protein